MTVLLLTAVIWAPFALVAIVAAVWSMIQEIRGKR